jgi:hypothetical protein
MSEAFDAMNLFAAQLKRDLELKVLVLPVSIKEKGVVVTLAMRKTHTQSDRSGAARVVKMRLAVEGSVESQKGLELALNAIEAIDAYLEKPRNLSDSSGSPIANTRIVQSVSEEDSFLPTPDSTDVQDAIDERLVILYLSR